MRTGAAPAATMPRCHDEWQLPAQTIDFARGSRRDTFIFHAIDIDTQMPCMAASASAAGRFSVKGKLKRKIRKHKSGGKNICQKPLLMSSLGAERKPARGGVGARDLPID